MVLVALVSVSAVSFVAGAKYGVRAVVAVGTVAGRVFAHLRDEFRAIEDKIEKL